MTDHLSLPSALVGATKIDIALPFRLWFRAFTKLKPATKYSEGNVALSGNVERGSEKTSANRSEV